MQKLIQFFTSLSCSWRLTEAARTTLLHSPLFKPSALFSQIDSDKKGAIELKDLQEYLRGLGFGVSEGEMFTVWKELDVGKKGYISRGDFEDYFGGVEGGKKGRVGVEVEVEGLVRRWFGQMIGGFARLEGKKREVVSVGESLFWKMDPTRTGEVSFDTLITILRQAGVVEPVIQDLTLFLLQKKETSLKIDFFLNLIEPFQQIPLLQTPNTVEPKFSSSSSSEALKKIYDETASLNLDEFFKTKMNENKERREFLERNERSRKELMEGILQRTNSPKLSFERKGLGGKGVEGVPGLDLETKGSEVFGIRKVTSVTDGISPPVSPKPLTQHSLLHKLRLNDENIKLTQKHLFPHSPTLPKDLSSCPRHPPTTQFSFNHPPQTTPHNLTLLIQKQQKQLQFQRSRRLQLESQISSYKRQHKDLSLIQPPLLYKPLQSIHPMIDYMNYSGSEAPVFQSEWGGRGQSAGRKGREREAGKIDYRGLGGGSRERVGREKESLEDGLRRSRLDREFARYKMNREGMQGKYLLWR